MYKALVVDDEKMIRMGIKMTVPWESMGISEVFTAASGQEGLEILEKEKPQILITDIQMTQMTGLELIAKIRQDNDELKVIVLTGYDVFDYARQCIHMRVDDFLLKPVDEDVLIATIQRLVDELNDKKEKLHEEKKQRRILGVEQQRQLETDLNTLIYQESIDQERLEKLENEYQYAARYGMRVAVLLSTMNMNGNTTSEDESFTMINVKNLLISYLDAQEYGITFENREGQIVMVLFEREKSDELEEMIKDFTELIRGEYNINVKVLLGSRIQSFTQLYIPYNEALLLFKDTNNYHTIIGKTGIKRRVDLFREIYRELVNVMSTNIGDTQKIMRAFDAFCQAKDSYNISDSYVRRCCFEIASAVSFSYMSDSGENVNSRINALMNTLMSSSREECCEITRNFLDNLLSPQEEEENAIIAESKRYIHQNLAEDLSVSSLAQKFYVTPNYFSRLFKRITGEGCNEYIVRKRIEQAKSMLESTNLKMGAIAQMVGYRDTNYFSLAFKKHTDMTPTQYRKEMRK